MSKKQQNTLSAWSAIIIKPNEPIAQESTADIFNSHVSVLAEHNDDRQPSDDEIIDMFSGFIDSLNIQQKFQEYLDAKYPLPLEEENG